MSCVLGFVDVHHNQRWHSGFAATPRPNHIREDAISRLYIVNNSQLKTPLYKQKVLWTISLGQ